MIDVIRFAATVATAASVALAVTGCGGNGEGDAEETVREQALTALYVIDHGDENPTGNALAPYEAAFRKLEARCEGSVEELASGVQDMATDASNGSGTHVTNLEALQALVSYFEEEPQPSGDSSGDCSGVFVGVEALLEGTALES
jgi:hypothetical protein